MLLSVGGGGGEWRGEFCSEWERSAERRHKGMGGRSGVSREVGNGGVIEMNVRGRRKIVGGGK